MDPHLGLSTGRLATWKLCLSEVDFKLGTEQGSRTKLQTHYRDFEQMEPTRL